MPLQSAIRTLLAALACALCLSTVAIAAPEAGKWVATWTTAPQLVEPSNLPPALLAHNTLRQFLRVSLGGSLVRLRFTNAYGTAPVQIQAAHLALGAGTPGDGTIDAGTSRALRFGGAPGAVIPAGGVLLSDPLRFDLAPRARVAVSLHLGELSSSVITGHPGSRTTSFIQTGNATAAQSLTGATPADRWYLVNGIDVLAPDSANVIAILGDSITDGNGTTTNGDNRWPDALAARLAAFAPTQSVAVANLGIGGNGVFGGLGPSAQNRFARDILGTPGVRWAVFFIGVNDLGGSSTPSTTATNLIAAYTTLATQARAKGLKVYGATITPFGANGYYNAAREAARQTVNTWIRTTAVQSGIYDATLDFDAVARDPANPVNLLAAYDRGDGLHLNPTGYAALAASIDLNLFTP